ncbi:MAG: hypothetical protein Q8934_01875 [Bacillota bacterium]|nr:hypothetical protein [Bacillota bacterium]
MKKTHETQTTKIHHQTNDDELYSPIEDLQKITLGGIPKKSSFQLSTLPKGIRYIGYFIIGFSVITTVLGILLSFFF